MSSSDLPENMGPVMTSRTPGVGQGSDMVSAMVVEGGRWIKQG